MEQASKNSLEQYRVPGAHPDAVYYIPNFISAAEEDLLLRKVDYFLSHYLVARLVTNTLRIARVVDT